MKTLINTSGLDAVYALILLLSMQTSQLAAKAHLRDGQQLLHAHKKAGSYIRNFWIKN